MDSFLEKVTLYDIVGYMIPGSVCVVLSGIQPFYYLCLGKGSVWKDYKWFIFCFILITFYVVGIALSELSYILIKNINMSKEIKEEIKRIKIDPYTLLEHSGMTNETSGEKDLGVCLKIMYSDIQTDPVYKRIHNYASAEVMYKNMFMALLVGDFFWIIGICCNVYHQRECNLAFLYTVAVIAFGLMCLYFQRWKRFYIKKVRYTVLWFSKKHQA